MSNKNIWIEFAKLNGLSPEEFTNELISATMAVMGIKLAEQGDKAIKATKGKYTLMLIYNEKEGEDEQPNNNTGTS